MAWRFRWARIRWCAGVSRTHAVDMNRRVVGALAVVATGGLIIVVRRRRGRRLVASGGWREDGGGTAGVREPRRPLPTTLVGAAAADPGE
jgi:hypothetical protein